MQRNPRVENFFGFGDIFFMEKFGMWRIDNIIHTVCGEICSDTIYAVLSQNLFY